MQGISPPPPTSNATLPGADPSQPLTGAPMSQSVEANIGQENVHSDPRIATLFAMFPDFDPSVLHSVLESVGGNQDQAIDVLLGMSDPSYVPPPRADVTQTDLDEQYARNLLLEESQARQDIPWRPRESPNTNRQPDQGNQRPMEGDSIAQLQEQIGKIAETGKKTFTSLFSKVKAKIQEFDSPSGQNAYSSTSTYPSQSMDSRNTSAPSQSYYDPNPRGYDVDPSLEPIQTSYPQSVPAVTASESHTVTSTEPSGTAAPTVTGVDPSSIGLLPKRPVTLASSPQPSRNVEDDDDLEYVENPFEENKHR